jgi:MFS family permease
MIAIQNYWVLAISRFFQGVASGSVWGSGLALLARCKDANSTLAWTFSSANIGGLVAPIIAGYLYKVHPTLPFMFLALLCSLQLLIFAVTFNLKSNASDHISSSTGLVESEPLPVTVSSMFPLILELLNNYQLNLLLAFSLIITALGMAMFVILVIHLSVAYSLPTDQIALCFLAIAPPQFVACILGGFIYDLVGVERTILIPLFITAITSFFFVIPMPLVPFMVCMTMFLSSTIVLVTPILPEIAGSVSEGDHVLAFSVFSIATSIGMMLGPILGSFMYTKLGFGTFMLTMGVARLVVVGLSFLYTPAGTEKTPSVFVI